MIARIDPPNRGTLDTLSRLDDHASGEEWVDTMDVGDWLRSLGLEKYEAAFRENEIDDTVLPNLTADDLRDLGVTIIGHRRRLLDAITALRSDRGTEAAPAAPQPIGPSATDTAERRQVTVLFSDLVGSTALSTRMDPEDLREVISAYQKCVAETVRRLDGFVAKYLGDGALVYFGYPRPMRTTPSGQCGQGWTSSRR